MIEDRDQVHPRRIVWDGTISAGNILTLISMVVVVSGQWFLMDKRVALLEQSRSYQTERDASQDQALKDTVNRIEKVLEELKQVIKEQRLSPR